MYTVFCFVSTTEYLNQISFNLNVIYQDKWSDTEILFCENSQFLFHSVHMCAIQCAYL